MIPTILNFIYTNWYWLAPAAFEVAVRIFPTEKDLSLINYLKLAADSAVKNKGQTGGKH